MPNSIWPKLKGGDFMSKEDLKKYALQTVKLLAVFVAEVVIDNWNYKK